LEGLYTTHGEARIMARTTVTQAEVDAVWQALWDRGYDSYRLAEYIAEAALKELAAGESMDDAIGYAERLYDVRPRGTWCPECREGGTEADWSTERCGQCGGWLEVA
jgi:hypothetical protein